MEVIHGSGGWGWGTLHHRASRWWQEEAEKIGQSQAVCNVAVNVKKGFPLGADFYLTRSCLLKIVPIQHVTDWRQASEHETVVGISNVNHTLPLV